MTRPAWSSWLRSPEPLTARDHDVRVPDVEPDHRWVLRLWGVVVLFVLVAVWRSRSLGIPFRDPGGEWLRHRVLITGMVFVVLALIDAAWRAKRDGGFKGTLRMLRDRWPARRLGLALVGLAAYHTTYFSYHNLKSWDVFNTVRDDLLDKWDRWLFFGNSPAVLLHDLLGERFATYFLIVVYESFPTLVSAAFVAAVVLADRMRHGFVYLASAIWVWILGVGCYYLIPSLGPFDYSPQEFSGLPHTIVTATQAKYMGQRAHLLAHPEASDAAAQVSAFASLHVGVTCVILLMLRYYGYRRLTRVLAVYLALTVVATVHLGWHFFVDDIAGVAIAVAAVWLGDRTIYPRGHQPAPAGTLEREDGALV